jgi:ATP-dependent Lhr-like helicase
MRRVLVDDVTYPYVDQAGTTAIAARRADLGKLLRSAGRSLPSQIAERAGHFWTFAGGQINHTLKYAIELTTGWKVIADNVQLRVEGAGITHTTLDEAIDKLRVPAFWASEETRKALFARVPDFRLSKFQQALPPACETEVVSMYLLDIEGTQRFLETPKGGG